MPDNNMADIIDTFVHKVSTNPKATNMNINGVLVTDENGLILANEDVKNDCSGLIASLSHLASTLLGQLAIICLENGDQKVIIREAGKAVVSIYTGGNRR